MTEHALSKANAFVDWVASQKDWQTLNALPSLTMDERLAVSRILQEHVNLESIQRSLEHCTARLNGYPLATHVRERADVGLYLLVAGERTITRQLFSHFSAVGLTVDIP